MTAFDDHLFGFREHLKVKSYSPASIKAYGSHLVMFLAYLGEKGVTDLRRVTRDVLRDYQLGLMDGKKYSTSTLALKVRSVKRFFEYLEEANHILINPAEDLREPKRGSRLPRTVLSNDELRKILDVPNQSTLIGIRDRTILEVFASAGIRLEELIGLTIYDADLQGGLLRVNKGKGAKDRVVPLGKHAVRFLKEYVSKVRPQHTRKNRSERTLFVTCTGKPVSKQSVEIMVRESARATGIGKKVTPHTFRHTFATGLVRNGADIRAVQKMLGHSDLRVTQGYTRVAGVEVKKTHQRHHPRERESATKEEIKPRIERMKERYREQP